VSSWQKNNQKEWISMIQLITASSNTSCRKARAWLIEHNIPFMERNIIRDPLTKNEIKQILAKTEEGVGDLLSIRSKAYQEINYDLETISLNTILDLITANQELLRVPILADELRLQVGYNQDDIRMFIPKEVRKLDLLKIYLTTY
jgi:regulatory protein spx